MRVWLIVWFHGIWKKLKEETFKNNISPDQFSIYQAFFSSQLCSWSALHYTKLRKGTKTEGSHFEGFTEEQPEKPPVHREIITAKNQTLKNRKKATPAIIPEKKKKWINWKNT